MDWAPEVTAFIVVVVFVAIYFFFTKMLCSSTPKQDAYFDQVEKELEELKYRERERMRILLGKSKDDPL